MIKAKEVNGYVDCRGEYFEDETEVFMDYVVREHFDGKIVGVFDCEREADDFFKVLCEKNSGDFYEIVSRFYGVDDEGDFYLEDEEIINENF